ncbi:helix-turn-helix domain-containing protein [Marinactinospora endophytica]
MPRRSYAHYCAAARALDAVGERWTLLIVRELLAGPRRYTDLHADLPGVSTDVLAARLKEMERDGLVERRRLPVGAHVYALTPRGQGLAPVLTALARWGADLLGERGPTDALRAHWFALPLLEHIGTATAGLAGTVEVRLDEGTFHLEVGDDPNAPTPARKDPAPTVPAARLAMDTATATDLAGRRVSFAEAVGQGRISVEGAGPLADALRGVTATA